MARDAKGREIHQYFGNRTHGQVHGDPSQSKPLNRDRELQLANRRSIHARAQAPPIVCNPPRANYILQSCDSAPG